MKVKLTATKTMNIPLTPDYCRHSATPTHTMSVVRWDPKAQKTGNMESRVEDISVCGSLDLRPGVPSEALHTAVLNIPQVDLAIRGRLIRKEMVQ